MKRIENKYIISGRDSYNKMLKFIFANKFEEIYKKRKINSIYFDYDNLKLFDYSEEGIASKDKIRFRYYGNNLDMKNINLEVKTSNAYSKIKYTSKFNYKNHENNKKIEIIKKNILLKKLLPKVKVSYERRYFFSKEYGRLTLDENIFYEKADWKKKLESFIFTKKIKEPRNVCEHKIENSLSKDNLIPVSNIRFSKYCEAIKRIYYKY